VFVALGLLSPSVGIRSHSLHFLFTHFGWLLISEVIAILIDSVVSALFRACDSLLLSSISCFVILCVR
jgi:hypothetical protein